MPISPDKFLKIFMTSTGRVKEKREKDHSSGCSGIRLTLMITINTLHSRRDRKREGS
jgi:hypothetical protein